MSQSSYHSSQTEASCSSIIVIINGFPGVGKFTVAKELNRLAPNAKVFDNHLLIDAVAALYGRDDSAYQPLRKSLRSAVFSSLRNYPASRPRVLIFTECQSNDSEGASVMAEYLEFASEIHCPLLSVILDCSATENASRMMHHGRAAGNRTKLMNLDILTEMRKEEVIHRYYSRVHAEIEVNTTGRSPHEVATQLSRQITEIIKI